MSGDATVMSSPRNGRSEVSPAKLNLLGLALTSLVAATPSDAQPCRVLVEYDERFFYSTEEIDLSFSLLDDGWTIAYRPEIVVEHRPDAAGRTVQPKVPGLRLRNRVLLVRRHLPISIARHSPCRLDVENVPRGTTRAWSSALVGHRT